MRPGIHEVEASRSVGAGCHAEAASDATVVVDGDKPAGRLVGGAGKADTHAGRVGAVVAEQEEAPLLDAFGKDGGRIGCEGVFKRVVPDPLHFLGSGDVGHVVELMAGIHDGLHLFRTGEAAGVYDHGPAMGLQPSG